MEHIQIRSSLDSKIQNFSTCSIRILSILEIIVKTSFFKNRKILNPATGRIGCDLTIERLRKTTT